MRRIHNQEHETSVRAVYLNVAGLRMKIYSFFFLLLLLISNSLAYTTSDQNQNLSIYQAYGASSFLDQNQNISIQSSTQAYFLSSDFNFTLAIFPLFSGAEASTTTSTTVPAGAGGGGGEGGGGVLDFTVSPPFFKYLLKPGETVYTNFTIKNTGNVVIPSILIKHKMPDFITIAEDNIELLPQQERTIGITFTASLEKQPDVYSGWISFETPTLTKNIIAIIEVKKLRPLFDIKVQVDDSFKKVYPGQVAPADMIIYNFGDLKPVDVKLFYSIRSIEDGKDITFRDETIAVNEQLLKKVNLTIPQGLPTGNYLFYGKLIYGDNAEASSSDLIEVVLPPPVQAKKSNFILITTIIASIILLLIIIVLYYLYSKKRKAREFEELLASEITARLKQGYSKEQILSSAKKAGWPRKMVKEILKRL